MNDLLGREVVPADMFLMRENILNKTVLVTGAGGSIGSELCRQIILLSPKMLILIENNEHALYLIEEELKILKARTENDAALSETGVNIVSYLACVRDKNIIRRIFKAQRPETVFHAAAYKHVPLVEKNPTQGIFNNVFGTLICSEASLEFGASHFILISTDKAVRPTNVMGASKRIAELVLQSFSDNLKKESHRTIFSIVRFGNVLGSSGSVAPLFSAQIKAGGPITLTHPDVTRYFMTIPEAAQLVIQASAMAEGGDVFVLDMGEPVRIYDLAAKMVHLSGHLLKDELNPQGDIDIQIIGLRSGEKLYEELLIGNNPMRTNHPKIMKAREEFMKWNVLHEELNGLMRIIKLDDVQGLYKALNKLVPSYRANYDSIDANLE
ncbi:MAG: hypothetical protein B7Y67_15410 [Polynucleobacter sp. 35-46-11]|nr:MAG: hypothetical protein B7Y67_15410 [Polynucleobacter sp. 35-46-11]